jgi:hypothetical protein
VGRRIFEHRCRASASRPSEVFWNQLRLFVFLLLPLVGGAIVRSAIVTRLDGFTIDEAYLWYAKILSDSNLTEMLGTYLFGFPCLGNPRNQSGWEKNTSHPE